MTLYPLSSSSILDYKRKTKTKEMFSLHSRYGKAGTIYQLEKIFYAMYIITNYYPHTT